MAGFFFKKAVCNLSPKNRPYGAISTLGKTFKALYKSSSIPIFYQNSLYIYCSSINNDYLCTV